MLLMENSNYNSAWIDLHAVLEFLGVKLNVQRLHDGLFRVTLQLRYGKTMSGMFSNMNNCDRNMTIWITFYHAF
ncbi:unnamed protein product [Haemonchus placei]|uniref:Recep_L_domain domain-containing protein n=1 Tax=Haemonchus placei TaxID=6290 RepID=A0A0N4X7X1_HAEPC|nr:unnamed protein product [Haemonchus placei]